MKFIAVITVPGYLPDSEPVEFDTAREAWGYLMSERAQDLWTAESFESPSIDATWLKLRNARQLGSPGTVYGDTPGYDGDHDLGLAYEVQAI